MKCKYNDCGWCYCSSDNSNDDNGQCNNPEGCQEHLIEKAKILLKESDKAVEHLNNIISKVKIVH